MDSKVINLEEYKLEKAYKELFKERTKNGLPKYNK